jgi:cell division protein FtsI (penicillin-binding protein 3)
MSGPGQGLRRRTLVVAVLFACGFLGVLARLIFLQVVKHDEYARLADGQHAKTIPLRGTRGVIVDRHGVVLALSARAESLFALPARVEDRAALARRLGPIIGEPAREIARRLESPRRFVFVKRHLSPETAQAVRALGEPALGFVDESMRLYPNRELAAHAVGFEGIDGKGLAGVEQSMDQHLAGVEGRALVGRDALGREMTGSPRVLRPAAPGRGVRLTIDSTLQYIAEREIDAVWRRTRSKAAMAVMMDPRTGEILAWAIRPTFNPNSFRSASDDDRRNRAVTDPFEPGSTFKVILAAAALESGVARPGDRFYGENGAITIAGATIHDWKKYGWLTFAEVLQNSSNVGSIKVGLSLGKDRYYHYITGFGFGAPTGVGFTGESRGQLRPPSQWSGLSLATMSIGQEISLTAIQLVAAVSAIANGGRLMQPQIVRELLDTDGREAARPFTPRVVRQVVSPDTARTLTDMMTAVVAGGTGRRAAIPGYGVAGKTGTAQKMDPGTRRYSRAPGVLSFVGFTPSDDPRLTMLVMLDEPRNEKWGSEAAAPVFAAIAGEALRHLAVPPRDTTPVALVRGAAGAGRPPAAAAPADGAGSRADAPAAPDPWAAGLVEVAAGTMPRLLGLSLRQALEALAPLDVDLEVAGRGVVVSQTPAPGVELEPGTRCQLTLASLVARPAASP